MSLYLDADGNVARRGGKTYAMSFWALLGIHASILASSGACEGSALALQKRV